MDTLPGFNPCQHPVSNALVRNKTLQSPWQGPGTPLQFHVLGPLSLMVHYMMLKRNRAPLYPGPSTVPGWLCSSKCCYSRGTCYLGCQGDDHGKYRRQSPDADIIGGPRMQVQAHLRSLAAGGEITDHFLGKLLLIPSQAPNVELKHRKVRQVVNRQLERLWMPRAFLSHGLSWLSTLKSLQKVKYNSKQVLGLWYRTYDVTVTTAAV